MINAPVSLFPMYIFITAAIVCFAAWGHIIPLPGWMQTLGLYAGMAAFVFACMAGLDWMVDRVTRYANIDDLLDPDARIAEAVCKANHEQLECLYNLYGFAPEPVTPADYVTLDDGTAVDRQSILQIAQNANGLNLRPENKYTANQPGIRYAHDALGRVGAIETGRGSRGPRKKDVQLFDAIVERAKSNGG